MGISVGLVVGLQLSGIIGSLFGWSPIFYITGIAGLAWSAVWFYVAKNSPEEDPHISAEELKFIKDSLGDSHNNLKETIKIKHPWGKILTCVPLWALILSNFCINWGHYTILTLLPMFMKGASSQGHSDIIKKIQTQFNPCADENCSATTPSEKRYFEQV
ncbi:hypothetical protein J6590_061237 [Homalodisca vitripennis]|nr:hypothetical protein J6590_061237 [Homalodisca vitripennis]